MAYADQSVSNRRIVAIVIVALLHAIIGYAFVTGLGIKYIKQAVEDLKTFDVKDEPPPPPDKPPPPPKETPKEVTPPVVAPPTIVTPPTIQAPPMVTTPTPPPLHIEAPTPPAPPRVSQAAEAKGNPASWVTDADYPPAAIRENRQGTTAIAWEINTVGRVENCRVTQSSGSPDLDETACRVLTRRGRYTPARDATGTPVRANQSRRIRWVVPKD